MAISFGGLATGLDTNALIGALMSAERAPLTRMEADKVWLNNRLVAFQDFDGKLNGFLDKIKNLGDRDQYFQRSVSTDSTDFFNVTASNDALPNTSYHIEVESLAQVQKNYSNSVDGLGNDIGFSSKTDQILGTGAFVINIDGIDHSIDVTAENNTLEGLMEAINDADLGVSAAIINDGTDSPYRLTLTGQTVGNAFTMASSGLTGGTESFGNFEESQPATQAHIIVDGLDIYSESNTVSEAIPGVTLDLLKAETGTNTTISISQNNSAVATNIKAFIEGYNEVVSFVTGQSTMGDTQGGILAGDSGLNAIKRHLQDTLTTLTNNNGSFKALSELGLETQKDGTITLNSETLDNAIETDLESVVSLLAGEEDGDGGLSSVFDNYLESLTNSTDGMLAGRKTSITSNIGRIDDRIEMAELRLGKREKTLKAQFTAMEQMVSLMNAQSSFLTQQMASISNIGNYNK
jgi:flagellar hook-associated protein 2